MPTLIHRRVAQARREENDRVICRTRAGWVVIGDVQFLRGYCLLLPDPVVSSLNDLESNARSQFLTDMAALGDVLLDVTGAARINYEILGNSEPALHAHLFPRYVGEPPSQRERSAWFYDEPRTPAFNVAKDGPLMRGIAAGLRANGVAV